MALAPGSGAAVSVQGGRKGAELGVKGRKLRVQVKGFGPKAAQTAAGHAAQAGEAQPSPKQPVEVLFLSGGGLPVRRPRPAEKAVKGKHQTPLEFASRGPQTPAAEAATRPQGRQGQMKRHGDRPDRGAL